RIVRGEQLQCATILSQLVVEKQLCFLFECLAEVLVEIWKRLGVGCHGSNVAKRQPLAEEVPDERCSTRVRQHASDLPLQDRGVAQPAARGNIEQFVVRDAAPEEKRQARGKIQPAQAIGRAGRRTWRITLDSEEEVGIGEDRFETASDAFIKATSARARR